MAYVNLLQVIYPVGSCYISFSATSPASIVGGSWSQIKSGLMMAIGSTGAATSAGGTGGSRKISTNQMPAHQHTIKGWNIGSAGAIASTTPYNWIGYENSGWSSSAAMMNAAGGGGGLYSRTLLCLYLEKNRLNFLPSLGEGVDINGY